MRAVRRDRGLIVGRRVISRYDYLTANTRVTVDELRRFHQLFDEGRHSRKGDLGGVGDGQNPLLDGAAGRSAGRTLGCLNRTRQSTNAASWC